MQEESLEQICERLFFMKPGTAKPIIDQHFAEARLEIEEEIARMAEGE